MNNIDYDNALTKLSESIKVVETKNRLDESAWESIKYGLSKLGRYKSDGKILGKKKSTKAAEDKIRTILNKESNKLLRSLDNEVKNVAPEFPNDKKKFTFLKGIITMGSFYDSIVEATKKNPKEDGYLPVDAANEIISDLREMVKKYLDVDLTAVYTTMEGVEGSEDILTEEEIELLYEKNVFQKIGGAIKSAKDKTFDKMFGSKKGSDKPDKKGSGQSAKFQKTSGNKDFETKRMGKEGLESNRLPIILNFIGASLGAYSWLVNTDWFKSLFTENISYTDTEEVTSIIEDKSEILTDIKPGEGVYKLLGRVTNTSLDGNSSPQQFIESLKEIGGGDPHTGVDLLCQEGGVMMKPVEAAKGLHDLVDNPEQYDTMNDLFKADASGTGKLIDPKSGLDTTLYGTKAGTAIKSILVKKVPVLITKVVTKTAVKTGAAYYTAKSLSNILGPIGVGLVLAGITVKVLREKGQRQSRAKTLNDLLQSLKNIEPTKENPPAIEQPKNDEVAGVTPPIDVPTDFLTGNRNMQLVYLSQNFLPGGQSLWKKLGLKEGTVLPTGFFDAALGQGKVDQEKYLKAFYKHLDKNNSFENKLNVGAWLAKIQSNETQSLIKWVRNTRKGIGNFIKTVKKTFPNFEIGERQKAKTVRPGDRGEAMGLAGESLNGKYNLLTELNLGNTLTQAGFSEKEFMKNLPQFMEMLSMMYYGAKGTNLSYNKEEVLKTCKKFGCKPDSTKKYKKTKSDDYQFMEGEEILKEEIKRISYLMK